MQRNKLDFSDVRRIAKSLADVQETTIHSAPALKVRGKLLTCRAIHKSAEPNSLAVRIGFKERERLLAADPGTYYLTDHYLNYPVILARLSQLTRDSLKSLLEMGCAFVNLRSKNTTKANRKPRHAVAIRRVGKPR
jgi:hypothetical protein